MISNFNRHYSELSKEVYNVSVPHGAQKIPAVKVRGLIRLFILLRKLRDELESQFNIKLPYLSMVMSGDFEEAIQEGSTHVRVGTSIFGKR